MPKIILDHGNYQGLESYRKSLIIYDATVDFCARFLKRGDRTIDQMIQAARSGKQNIAEGSAASATSSETELKLINVAKASLHELLVDYEDYLRVRQLQQWAGDDPRSVQTRKVCAKHNDSAFYRSAIETRSAETIANIAITLIHQEDFMLRNLLNRLQDDFVKHGGIKERMFQARLNYRNKTGDKK